MGFRFLIFICIFWIQSLGLAQVASEDQKVEAFFVQKVKRSQIRIMSINTLNLYDTKHDDGYFDFTFLPKSHPDKSKECATLSSDYYRNLCQSLNWNNTRLKKKLGQIAKIATRHGSKPDVLALQEVENKRVVQALAKKLGYKKLLVTDQVSKRGIDVALLWNPNKVRYVDHTEIPANLRDPLRVEFEMRNSGESLFVYVNHWPAQSAPTNWRVNAAKAVKADINSVMKALPDANIVMVGDFNVTSKEDASVFQKNLTGSRLKNRMYDLHQVTKKAFPKNFRRFPPGTYWRGGTRWNRFDRILVNRNLMEDNTRADVKSYRIVASKLLTGVTKVENPDTGKEIKLRVPLSYNFLEEKGRPLGFSDHLPVSVLINDL